MSNGNVNGGALVAPPFSDCSIDSSSIGLVLWGEGAPDRDKGEPDGESLQKRGLLQRNVVHAREGVVSQGSCEIFLQPVFVNLKISICVCLKHREPHFYLRSSDCSLDHDFIMAE